MGPEQKRAQRLTWMMEASAARAGKVMQENKEQKEQKKQELETLCKKWINVSSGPLTAYLQRRKLIKKIRAIYKELDQLKQEVERW